MSIPHQSVLSRTIWGQLVAVLRHRVGCPQAAQDLAQETVIAGMERGNLDESYLLGIARHKAFAYFRDKTRANIDNVSLDESRIADTWDPWAVRDGELREAELQRQIERLPRDSQVLVFGLLQGDRNKKQIAADLSLSHDVVRQRWSRILKALRSAMLGTMTLFLIAGGLRALGGTPSNSEIGVSVSDTPIKDVPADIENPVKSTVLPPYCRSNLIASLRRVKEGCQPELWGETSTDPRKCETKDLDRHAIADGDFMTLMLQFPNTMAIHFPAGQPSPMSKRRWPNNDESAHYINRMRESVEEFKAADRIIMVGLASRDRQQKDPNANKAITLQRLLATQSLLYRTASSVLTPDEAAAIKDKTVFFQLGDQRTLDARFYSEHYSNRPVAWDSGTEARLRHLVEDRGRTADPADLRWRDRTLNQVVFVIPIPCEGGRVD